MTDQPASPQQPRPGRRTGRPSSATHPVVSARCLDGGTIAWSDGVFAGDPHLVERARLMADLERPASLTPHGPTLPAGTDTPNEAAAAILLSAPGRIIFVQPPPALTPPAGSDDQH